MLQPIPCAVHSNANLLFALAPSKASASLQLPFFGWMSDPLLGVFQFPVLYIDDHKHIPCYITAIIDAHLASILWSSPPWTLPLSLLLVCVHSVYSSKAILQPVRHLEVITASNTEEGASCRLKPSSNNQMLMEVIHPNSVSFDRERTSLSTTKQNPHITLI